MTLQRRKAKPNPTAGFKFAKPTREEKPVKWPRKRLPKRLERDKIYEPFHRWVRSQPCVICGRHRNIQASHVGWGGAGQPRGGGADVVPMCGPGYLREGCHAEWEQKRAGTRLGPWSREARLGLARGWRLRHWRTYLVVATRELADVGTDRRGAILDCHDAIARAIGYLDTA